MRYGEHKTVLRDARLRTTAAEDDALDRLADMMRRNGITGPYRYILGRDNYTVCGYHNSRASHGYDSSTYHTRYSRSGANNHAIYYQNTCH